MTSFTCLRGEDYLYPLCSNPGEHLLVAAEPPWQFLFAFVRYWGVALCFDRDGRLADFAVDMWSGGTAPDTYARRALDFPALFAHFRGRGAFRATCPEAFDRLVRASESPDAFARATSGAIRMRRFAFARHFFRVFDTVAPAAEIERLMTATDLTEDEREEKEGRLRELESGCYVLLLARTLWVDGTGHIYAT